MQDHSLVAFLDKFIAKKPKVRRGPALRCACSFAIPARSWTVIPAYSWTVIPACSCRRHDHSMNIRACPVARLLLCATTCSTLRRWRCCAGLLAVCPFLRPCHSNPACNRQ